MQGEYQLVGPMSVDDRLVAWRQVEGVLRRYIQVETKPNELMGAWARLGSVRSRIRSLIEIQRANLTLFLHTLCYAGSAFKLAQQS
jgi:hypothetical protein